MSLPTLTIEVDAPSTLTSSYLTVGSGSSIGTSLIVGPVIWADRTSYARDLTITSGSEANGMVWTTDAATATVSFSNLNRTFDPVSNSDIRPGRAIRIRATWSSTTYDLFRGSVDSWSPTYPGQAADAVTIAEANDGTAVLANAQINSKTPEETTGRRIRRLADAAGWSDTLRDIDTGLNTMNAGQQTASAWSAMQDAAVSEFGELYVERDGKLTFRDRNALWTETRTRTSQATFGDGASELPYAELEPIGTDVANVRNQITISYNEDNGQVTWTDSGSTITWGVRSDSLQVSLAETSTARAYVRFLLSQFAQPRFTFGKITIVPQKAPATLWPQVLGRKLGDRITIKLTPPGGGSRISREAFIRSIEHSVTPGGWSTTFGLQDASYWPDVFVINSHNVGDTTNKIGW